MSPKSGQPPLATPLSQNSAWGVVTGRRFDRNGRRSQSGTALLLLAGAEAVQDYSNEGLAALHRRQDSNALSGFDSEFAARSGRLLAEVGGWQWL